MNTAPHIEFEHLAAEHRDQVYRQMLRLCGNREDAEDVLTDALIAALRGFENLRERAAFGAWLAQIARRLCFHLRSQKKIEAALSLEQLDEEGLAPAQPDQPSPEELLLRNELRRAVQHAIEVLPDDLRQVYILRDLEELSGEDTAQHLGLTLAAMKSRLHRARKLVRQQMDALFTQAAAPRKEANP